MGTRLGQSTLDRATSDKNRIYSSLGTMTPSLPGRITLKGNFGLGIPAPDHNEDIHSSELEMSESKQALVTPNPMKIKGGSFFRVGLLRGNMVDAPEEQDEANIPSFDEQHYTIRKTKPTPQKLSFSGKLPQEKNCIPMLNYRSTNLRSVKQSSGFGSSSGGTCSKPGF